MVHTLVALASVLACIGTIMPPEAHADGINGFMEFGYNSTKSETKDEVTGPSDSDSTTYLQRYSLSLDRTLFPQLRLNVGGLFEKITSDSTTDGIDSEASNTRFIPRGDLILFTPLYDAGISYNRREEKSKTDGVSSPTDVVETMSARLAMRPEALPTLNLFYTRTNFFDDKRESQDTTNDSYTLSSNYKPIKDLDLNYLGLYTKQTDRLNNQEITSTTHDGRVSYSRQFMEGRAAVTGTYNITQQTSENLRLIATPLPIMAAVASNPAAPLAANDTTNPNFTVPSTALTNGSGDLPDSSGERYLIKTLPGSTQPIRSDYLHFGLDLQLAAPTNTITVTVNQDVTAIQGEFTWQVYYSNNNSNDWQPVPAMLSSIFRASSTEIGILPNSFELRFTNISARYFKVVVQQTRHLAPISPPLASTEVYVTEVHSFIRIAESTRSTTSETLSHLVNLSGRVRLYDPYDVNYEFFYNYNKSETDFFTATRYTISNALRAQRRLNQTVTASARVSREDTSEPQADRVAYLYSAMLQAMPLPNLTHTLVYSGRTESTDTGNNTTNSFYLNNFASPYRGVDLSLSAGYSTTTDDTDKTTDTLSLNIGGTFTPNPKLTLNVNYAGSNVKQSGGTNTTPDKTTNRGDLTLSYNPVPAIYLHCAFGIQTETDRDTVTTQSYGGSWGILRDGSLQLNIAYSENLNPSSNQKDRSLVPSLRWNIRPGSYLDISYLISHSETDTQDSDFTTVTALLRIGL
jgi:hypothetical protein